MLPVPGAASGVAVLSGDGPARLSREAGAHMVGAGPGTAGTAVPDLLAAVLATGAPHPPLLRGAG